jgi:hypothetical protein
MNESATSVDKVLSSFTVSDSTWSDWEEAMKKSIIAAGLRAEIRTYYLLSADHYNAKFGLH